MIGSNCIIFSHPAGTGENDTIVQLRFYNNFTTVSLQVRAVNACGISSPRTTSISIIKPSPLGAISSVNTSACPNRVIKYAVSALPANTDSIIWSIPSSGTILSGQGTTRISVSYPPSASFSGYVSAKGINNCSVGNSSILRVSFVACTNVVVKQFSRDEGLSKDEHFNINIYPNPTAALFNLKVNSQRVEKISITIYDLQGRLMQRLMVNPNELNQLGRELMPGNYFIEIKQGVNSKIERLIKL